MALLMELQDSNTFSSIEERGHELVGPSHQMSPPIEIKRVHKGD